MRTKFASLLTTAALSLGAAQVASAADLPARGPVYKAAPVAPFIDWTGFYVGGHIGGGWGTKDIFDPSQGEKELASGNVSGFLGGVQAGYNYQANSWLVLGIEGDFSWANVNGGLTGTVIDPSTGTARADWFATLTGRVGYSFDHALLYAKGGAAWVHDKYSVSPSCTPVPPHNPTEGLELVDECEGPYNAASTNLGWTVGVGLEYALTRNWSAKIEYNYMDFGTKHTQFTDPDGDAGFADIRQRVSVVKAGVNYKFDWGTPILAKY